MSPSALKSDLVLDASLFQKDAIDPRTHENNDAIIKIMEGHPRWEVGAGRFRQMRWNGETALPKPVVLDSAKNIEVPSRDSSRTIPCRIFHPQNSNAKSKGTFYHIHGGGWVLQSHEYQDVTLQYLADHLSMVILSVGYRLAPEHPYPAGNEDCFDVAEWLVENAEREYGAPMKFIGGDSAGAHLSVCTTFHLLKSKPFFAFKGLVLNYGAYDVSGYLPQTLNFDQPLVLDGEIVKKFIRLPFAPICASVPSLTAIDRYIEAYLPNTTAEQRRDSKISPFFADLTKMKLPSALFLCGTLDCLLDDSVMMSAKWGMSGAESIFKAYPGAPHGFAFFPPNGGEPQTKKALDDIVTYVRERC